MKEEEDKQNIEQLVRRKGKGYWNESQKDRKNAMEGGTRRKKATEKRRTVYEPW